MQNFKWHVREAKPLFRSAGPEFEPIRYEESIATTSTDTDQQELSFREDPDERRYNNVDPSPRDPDVVTSDTTTSVLEEELPAPQTTRSLLARFKSMEDINRPAPTPERTEHLQKHAQSALSLPRTNAPRDFELDYESDDVSVDRTYENVGDVTREDDVVDEDELPMQGTARNLMAKWQAMGQ